MAIEFPDLQDVRNGILCGAYDEHLALLMREINERKKRTREFIEWIPGDRVQINDTCRPQYLVGEFGTIKDVKRTKVVIHLDKDKGRFRAGQNITVPMALLDRA